MRLCMTDHSQGTPFSTTIVKLYYSGVGNLTDGHSINLFEHTLRGLVAKLCILGSIYSRSVTFRR